MFSNHRNSDLIEMARVWPGLCVPDRSGLVGVTWGVLFPIDWETGNVGRDRIYLVNIDQPILTKTYTVLPPADDHVFIGDIDIIF